MTTVSSKTVLRPWPALWSLIIGFFMILIDTTIVSVANPAIMRGLDTDINTVIWVTSAYLLAYAVPLLVTGRLGDRFGPKWVYLGGLAVFTAASAWCGFAATIGMLILARVVQGLGAAFMAPQTMAVITRIFPPDQRGKAMGLWGAVAGVATLAGPILGGLLVDSLGWEWVFFVNVPVGIAGFLLAWRFVPELDTHPHRFDLVGVVLSGVGMFLLIFGIEEGERYDWGVISGLLSIPLLIGAGLALLTVFLVWQARMRGEPLLPLGLFRDRNFSLGNAAITAVGFCVTALSMPLAFYYQIARGMTPTQAALMLMPMAVVALILSPVVGRLLDRVNPRPFAVAALLILAATLVSFWLLLSTGAPIWELLLASAALGLANAGMWGPIGNATVRNLPLVHSGAGSGVYNATRQVGAVLGSASIAALIQARLTAELGAGAAGATGSATTGGLPAALADGFGRAMGQSLLLPAAVAVLAAITVAFLEAPTGRVRQAGTSPVPPVRGSGASHQQA